VIHKTTGSKTVPCIRFSSETLWLEDNDEVFQLQYPLAITNHKDSSSFCSQLKTEPFSIYKPCPSFSKAHLWQYHNNAHEKQLATATATGCILYQILMQVLVQ